MTEVAVTTSCPTPYRRRRPERTLLYRTVQTHFATWLALTREGAVDGDPVPAHVEREFRRYLTCGILAHGFARARCGDCGHDSSSPSPARGAAYVRRATRGAWSRRQRISPITSSRACRCASGCWRCRSAGATSCTATPTCRVRRCACSCGRWSSACARAVRMPVLRHDLGGGSAGLNAMASDVYQEGLLLPPLKFSLANDWNGGTFERLLAANIRVPDLTLGDFNAQFAAKAIGIERIRQLCTKYGVASVKTTMIELMDYAERQLRAAIRALPDGIYLGADAGDDIEGSGSPLWVKAKVTISGDTMEIDFEGTCAQVGRNIRQLPAGVDEGAVRLHSQSAAAGAGARADAAVLPRLRRRDEGARASRARAGDRVGLRQCARRLELRARARPRRCRDRRAGDRAGCHGAAGGGGGAACAGCRVGATVGGNGVATCHAFRYLTNDTGSPLSRGRREFCDALDTARLTLFTR